MKKKISIMMALIMTALVILPVVVVNAATTINVPVSMEIKDESGKALKSNTLYTDILPGDKITITANCLDEKALYWSKSEVHMSARGLKANDEGMAILAHIWDNEGVESARISEDPTKMVVTIPEFEAGSTHRLLVQGVSAVDHYSPDDNTTYISTTGWVEINFTIPEIEEETKIDVNLKKNNKIMSTSKTIIVYPDDELVAEVTSNDGIKLLGYKWDDEPSRGGAAMSYVLTLPEDFEPGTTHTLKLQAVSEDGTKTPVKEYKIKVYEPEEDDEDYDDEEYDDEDELFVEPWMEENDEMDTIAVSLRNDSEEDKANKNIYELNEEVIYYVDYKNGGRDTKKDVTLVLNVPETFKVVNSDGGKVSTSKGTITWNLGKLEEEESGTKTVVLKYTKIGGKNVTYKTLKPLAEIKLDGKVKDSSAVINLVYKDADVEIKNSHDPYMFGDANATTFRPDDGITRGEAALVLTRTLGLSTSYDRNAYNYPDLDETYLEARKAIVAATAYGLVEGYEDGYYRPNQMITRAEFMTIIANRIEAEEDEGFEIKDSSNSIKRYKDKNKIYIVDNSYETEHWALDEVTLLARLNMTPLTDSNKNLRLDEPITRAEVAQFMNYFLLRAPAEVTSKTKSEFSDVSKKHKLFADILEATREEHTYYITEDTTEDID